MDLVEFDGINTTFGVAMVMKYDEVKFVIVGGGSAGWITALKVRSQFPNNNITLIESSEIGILGAGEGTTPHFIEFLRDVEIDLNDFIKNTKATFKTGIKFTNWHGDGSYYFHPFIDSRPNNFDGFNDRIAKIKFISEGKNLNEISLSNYCSEQNKTNHYMDDNYNIVMLGNNALHFDARLTAEYLKSVAVSRNVNLIDSKVISSVHDQEGNISHLIIENGNGIECDFVFDCSGFARKIIGGAFKEKWLDYQNSLPADRALPFFIQNETNVIPPYTEAIAMKYGWIWKIPVKDRFGCGYVFDSSYVSDKEIEEEIVNLFGNVTIPRAFSFKAGYFENTWVKNCVAIGLSTGFIEPLEATSIYATIVSLDFLLHKYFPAILNPKLENYKIKYNTFVRNFNDQIKSFLQLHYLTERKDSRFWLEFKTKNTIVDSLKEYDNLKMYDDYIETSQKIFKYWDPWYVCAGVKSYPQELFGEYLFGLKQQKSYEAYNQDLTNYKNSLKNFAECNAIDHFKLINHINTS